MTEDATARRAEILTIGDELLSGETIDTNSSRIDTRLERWGWTVARHTTVPDDIEAIASALREAAARTDLILTSGGLGPTEDDLTLEACARALGCGLRRDEATLARIEARFRSFGREMTPNNERQADVPEVGSVLENGIGTAPGFRFELDGALVFVLPGVPREVEWFLEHKLGALLDSGAAAVGRRTVKTIGLGESQLAHRLKPIVLRYQDRCRFGYRALGTETHIKLAADTGGDLEVLDEVETALREELGDRIFGVDDLDLVSALAHRLNARGETVSTAESCTGGLIGKLLTDRPGSSGHYLGGCVTYSDESKVQILGIDDVDLEIHGAVSEPIARKMAVSVRKRFHADWGLSTTGIAGPDGGTRDKPVGLVFIGLAGPRGSDVRRLQIPGDRDQVRTNTAKILLDWLRRSLHG